MLIAVDVQYAELAVVTAAVGFIDWSDPSRATAVPVLA
jgi:deoxyribonuclease V